MAKCDLTIHVDKADRTFAPGERIRGHVTVRTDESVRTKGLTVALQWRTHGRGNTNSGPESKVQLFEGEWGGGEQHAYGFEFIAPAGPATYHGNFVNVDHYLTARVDLPWALDPKAVTEVLIVPGPGAAEHDFGPSYQPPATELKGQGTAMLVGSVLTAGCFGVPGLLIIAGGIAFLVSWMRGKPGAELGPALFMIPFGGVFAAVGFGVAFLLQKRRLAQTKLGNPLVNVSPALARAGDRISVQVTLQPRSTVRLSGAKAVLKGQEQAVSGSGTNKTTHTHVMHTAEAGFGAPPTLEAGQQVSFSTSVQLPRDAACTFAASSNSVKWCVEIQVGIQGWPDWEREYPITVRP